MDDWKQDVTIIIHGCCLRKTKTGLDTSLNSLLQFLFFLLKWKVCLWYNFCRITKFCCKKKNMVNVMLSLRETVVSLCLLRKRACTSTDFEEELLRMVSCRCFWDLHSCLSFHVFLLNLSLSLSFLWKKIEREIKLQRRKREGEGFESRGLIIRPPGEGRRGKRSNRVQEKGSNRLLDPRNEGVKTWESNELFSSLFNPQSSPSQKSRAGHCVLHE